MMAKFYIQSGELRDVIDADDADAAAHAAVKSYIDSGGRKLGHLIVISERGFPAENGDFEGDDLLYSTQQALDAIEGER